MVFQLAHATAPSAPMDLSPQRGGSPEVEENPGTRVHPIFFMNDALAAED
jgi:hypothetical protein